MESYPELSKKELNVLRCWAVGQTDEMTADQLGLSIEHVIANGKRACFLLRAKSEAHAVANAIRAGLI